MNGRDSGVTIQTMPDRLDSLKWILVGGFARSSRWDCVRLAPAGCGDGAASPGARNRGAAAQRPAKRSQAAAAAATLALNVPASVPPPQLARAVCTAPRQAVQNVARDVEQSLDGLKDRLFRLELRRQAGTISEEEYARERSRTEQVLRELVRG